MVCIIANHYILIDQCSNVCLVAMIHYANLNGRNSLINTISQGESGEARVARVCENDQGYDGSFMTDRYGGLSCNHLEVNELLARFSE